ncbi:hypothetical protein [Glutamicibacter creatinolyticus]|uniref:hypothetical protein n=1 Tax=Glutamicibacter creatinolyticus TaxID=162496 RepID=UPI003217A60A
MKPGIIRATKDSQRMCRLVKWLRANGVDPNLVPSFEPLIFTGSKLIVHEIKTRHLRYGGKIARFHIADDACAVLETRRRVFHVRVPFGAIK